MPIFWDGLVVQYSIIGEKKSWIVVSSTARAFINSASRPSGASLYSSAGTRSFRKRRKQAQLANWGDEYLTLHICYEYDMLHRQMNICTDGSPRDFFAGERGDIIILLLYPPTPKNRCVFIQFFIWGFGGWA